MSIKSERLKESRRFFLEGEEFLKLCKANGKVFLFEQRESAFFKKYALCFDDTDFWIDCFDSRKQGKAKAQRLGLHLV